MCNSSRNDDMEEIGSTQKEKGLIESILFCAGFTGCGLVCAVSLIVKIAGF